MRGAVIHAPGDIRFENLEDPKILKPTDAIIRTAVTRVFIDPLTCVNAVLPGMRTLGRGSLLFVNGGSAVRPNPKVAGTSIAFAAESAYAQMLHTALTPENIHVAQLIVPGAISPDSATSSPEKLAELLYGLHTDRDGFRRYAEPMPDPQDSIP
ncbi:short-subunit dehydrogenase [Streptomyces sp. DSM 42143]|nr:short-subunit dehydrogenase [Streptomyces sp. DSM 42143]